MNSYSSNYQNYIKPSFSPPSWVFGPVWAFLYSIIFVTYGYVFYLFLNKKINIWILLPFVLNLVFNFSFTYFQFKLGNNLLASIDILLILATIIWMFLVIFPVNKYILYANIPYLLWVSFATIVQLSITYLNWK
jgi:tryptophan-rich sensory protein